MDTTKLYAGQTFPSYKALCRFIGEVDKNDKTKKARHYEYLKDYFDFKHITTQKIEILKVHEAGLFSERIMRDRKSDDLAKIIAYNLQQNQGELIVTWSELLEMTGSITGTYNHIDVVDAIAKKYGSEKNIRLYANNIETSTYSRIKKIHTTVLDTMTEKGLITCDKTITVIKNNGEVSEASKYEHAAILRAEDKVLKKLGYFNMSDVFICDKAAEYYKLVNEQLSNLDIKTYIRGVKIKICSKVNINEVTKEELIAVQKRFTSKLYERVFKTLTVYYNNKKHEEEVKLYPDDIELYNSIANDVLGLTLINTPKEGFE